MTARTTHIFRIFQDGDSKSSTWVDVERIDELDLIVNNTQRYHYIFDWDPFEAPDYSGPSKKIVDPNDKNSKIDVPIRNAVNLVGPKGRVLHQFLNDETNQSRLTHSRRVYHHEIKAAYLVDGKPPSDPQQYLDSLGTQYKDQFIDVEILDAYRTTGYDRNDVHVFPLDLTDGVTRGSKGTRQTKNWLGKTDDPFMNEPIVPGDEEGGSPSFSFIRNPDAGPQIDPPVRLDPLQNIVNVNWASNIIVVFVDGVALEAQPSADYAVSEDVSNVQHLTDFRSPYQGGGFQPGLASHAYKVPSDAKEFIKITAPGGVDADGYWTTAIVFASDGDAATSLERAISGTKKIIPAIYMLSHSGDSDIPADMTPPGMLWIVETGRMYSSKTVTWKIRFGTHRPEGTEDSSDSLPNLMMQCYPRDNYSGPNGPDTVNWTGYKIYGYRLDKNGTGTVYSEMLSADDDNRQNIDSAWSQPIVFPGNDKGIPIQDPPPLIATDMTT